MYLTTTTNPIVWGVLCVTTLLLFISAGLIRQHLRRDTSGKMGIRTKQAIYLGALIAVTNAVATLIQYEAALFIGDIYLGMLIGGSISGLIVAIGQLFLENINKKIKEAAIASLLILIASNIALLLTKL
jgi:hypothetical protein